MELEEALRRWQETQRLGWWALLTSAVAFNALPLALLLWSPGLAMLLAMVSLAGLGGGVLFLLVAWRSRRSLEAVLGDAVPAAFDPGGLPAREALSPDAWAMLRVARAWPLVLPLLLVLARLVDPAGRGGSLAFLLYVGLPALAFALAIRLRVRRFLATAAHLRDTLRARSASH